MIKPLIAHNYYQEAGGEDQVFAAESSLLRDSGHTVLEFTLSNDDVDRLSKAALAGSAIWSSRTYRRLRSIIRREKPDVLHLHNTLPLISPAAYYAARHENIAVVQTLHNYRLICPKAILYRDDAVCEQCVNTLFSLPSVKYACYRQSRQASGVVAAMLAIHRMAGTWVEQIDVYIALTEFARSKFVEGGLPPEKIVVKPNFLANDPMRGDGSGAFALFVGRLAPEKGLHTLLHAWSQLDAQIPLKIVGDGPLASTVRDKAEGLRDVEWLGRLNHEEVLSLMKRAHVLVFPSQWYEGFPMTIVEAFAVGLPVIGSKLGSMASLIEHGRTGLHFCSGDARDLAQKVMWSFEHGQAVEKMRSNARAEFEAKYDGKRNYALLTNIYERAIMNAARSDPHEPPQSERRN